MDGHDVEPYAQGRKPLGHRSVGIEKRIGLSGRLDIEELENAQSNYFRVSSSGSPGVAWGYLLSGKKGCKAVADAVS